MTDLSASQFRTRVAGTWKRAVGRGGRRLQVLWRWRLGWLAGHHLAVVTHVGRRTGSEYRTVLWVYRYDRRTRAVTVISVWGESQWFRNICQQPARQVEIALQRYRPRQEFLTGDEILSLEKQFRAEHRIIAWGQAKLMAWPWPATDDQLRELTSRMRAVTFQPDTGR